MNEYEQALTMIMELEDTVAELLEALEEINDACNRAGHPNTTWLRNLSTEAIRKAKGN